MKVALVHDWLTGMRGGERCLEAFLDIYPDADIHTLLHLPGSTSRQIDQRVKKCSFLQSIPGIGRLYRYFLPFYPWAVAQFDFKGYDLVISLSHAAAKNIKVPKGVPHISYCFTPMRYVWDKAQDYFGALTPFVWPILRTLRRWDYKGGQRPLALVAISQFVSARIRCFYGRDSQVIYPPVSSFWIKPLKQYQRGQAFLYAGALVPYKQVEAIIQAFNKNGQELWVVGTGPEESRLKKMSKGNISFYGRVPDSELAEFYRNCRALIFAGTEDFGIVPVECMAAGRPVIGLDDGGLKETIAGVRYWNNSGCRIDQATGVFVRKRGDRVKALIDSVNFFMEHEDEFKPEACVEQAKKFGPEVFFDSWQRLLEDLGVKEKQPNIRSVVRNV